MAKRGPGKFETDLDAALYELALDQGIVDEEVGSSSEPPGTWAGLMRGGASLALAIQESGESGEAPYRDVDADDLRFLRASGKAGVIVMEHDSGRVEVAYYDTPSKLDQDWKQAEADLYVAEFDRNGEEDLLRDEIIEPFLKGKGPVFQIQIWETEKRDQSRHRGGRPMLGFRITMTEPGGRSEVVYEGEDYSPSPMIELDSDRTIDDIVAFFVNDYEDETRTARQKEVVRKYGDTLSAVVGATFGEDSEGREENPNHKKPVVGHRYRLVHPDGDETVTVLERDPGDFLVKPGFKKGPLVVVRIEGGSDDGDIGPVNVSDLRPIGGARAENGTVPWVVILNGEETDRVFFAEDMDADDVKRSLVNHDGYDARITVKKRPRRKTHAPDALAENRRSRAR